MSDRDGQCIDLDVEPTPPLPCVEDNETLVIRLEDATVQIPQEENVIWVT